MKEREMYDRAYQVFEESANYLRESKIGAGDAEKIVAIFLTSNGIVHGVEWAPLALSKLRVYAAESPLAGRG